VLSQGDDSPEWMRSEVGWQLRHLGMAWKYGELGSVKKANGEGKTGRAAGS
jgi:hypothetical protein